MVISNKEAYEFLKENNNSTRSVLVAKFKIQNPEYASTEEAALYSRLYKLNKKVVLLVKDKKERGNQEKLEALFNENFEFGAEQNGGENASGPTPDDVIESNQEADNLAGKVAAFEKICQEKTTEIKELQKTVSYYKDANVSHREWRHKSLIKGLRNDLKEKIKRERELEQIAEDLGAK